MEILLYVWQHIVAKIGEYNPKPGIPENTDGRAHVCALDGRLGGVLPDARKGGQFPEWSHPKVVGNLWDGACFK